LLLTKETKNSAIPQFSDPQWCVGIVLSNATTLYRVKKVQRARNQWLTPIILATWEAETERIVV
jgi:hypothetical protein